MTSKEALEHICKTCDNESCPYIHYEKSRCVYYGIVRKDLERLEKLEQIVGVIKEIGLTFQKDLRYYECDYGDWFKTPYAIENHPVSKEEWELFKEIFGEKEGGKNND